MWICNVCPDLSVQKRRLIMVLLFFTGLILPPVPPVMKTTKISIPKLNNMESSVQNFTRYEKVQIEYIMLMSLTKLLQPQHGDLGYKG